jgi:4'-phosphopantetheinyl transferase
MEPIHPVIMPVPADALPVGGRERTVALRRLARAALARSASFSGVVLGPLEQGDRGQPLPSCGNHWSLSHASSCVAAATARFPIGIDVERIAAFTPALKERLASPSEWARASPVDDILFCRFWTAKEAVLKAAGAGLSGLPRCTIEEVVSAQELRLRYDSVTWTVSHCFLVSGYLASVTAAPGMVTWHLIELECA